MDFLKKHYEKIILSVVLLAVIYFALLLPAKIRGERVALQDLLGALGGLATNRVQSVDLAGRQNLLKQLVTPATNQFAGSHNLFNPVPWKRRKDGTPYKVPTNDEIVNQFRVTAIRPLKFIVAIEEGVTGAGDSLRIKVSVTDQSLMPKNRQRPQMRQPKLAIGDANDLFKVISFKGEPANLTDLVLELKKNNRQITIARGKPFEEVVGHEADAVFELENKTFKELREGSSTPIRFNEESYKVIAITPATVTIEAQTTPKRYVRPLTEPAQP
jgi:hypothetical protein